MGNKTWNKWTEDEIKDLKFHWENSSMEVLMDVFAHRTYNSLMLKAQNLKIKSKINRKRNIIKSLNQSTTFTIIFT